MSNGRWIKPAGRTTYPRAVASVVVTRAYSRKPGQSSCRVARWAGATVAWSYLRKNGWSAVASTTVGTGDELHDLLERLAPARGRLWVVSPTAGSCLTLSGWLLRIETRGAVYAQRATAAPTRQPSKKAASISKNTPPSSSLSTVDPPKVTAQTYIIRSMVMSGKPDYVHYSVGGKTLTWVSTPQYFPVTEDAAADLIGVPRGPEPGDATGATAPGADAGRRAAVWLGMFQRLSDWWKEVDGGPFGPTPGALAMSYVRKRIRKKTLLSHTVDGATQLEERAIFGGRASTWFYGRVIDPANPDWSDLLTPPGAKPGDIMGPVEHWDISGMYPHILMNERFPCQLLKVWEQPSVELLGSMLKSWAVLADVRLRSDRPEYPHRKGDRVIYPTGEYSTTLCGPELIRALAAGEVVACHRACTYIVGNPFREAAGELLKLRQQYTKPGHKVWEMFVKLVSNNIGGKFAQRRFEWQRRPFVLAPRKWHTWTYDDMRTGKTCQYRARAGLVDERVPHEAGGRPLAAVFAYITAYGRDLMYAIRSGIPADHVVSQDTDGLWTRPLGEQVVTAIRRKLSDRGYSIRRTTAVPSGRWYGPRHYWTPDGWVLAGLSDPSPGESATEFGRRYSVNPACGSCSVAPLHVFEYHEDAILSEVHPDGRVLPSGWVSPYVIRPPLDLEELRRRRAP